MPAPPGRPAALAWVSPSRVISLNCTAARYRPTAAALVKGHCTSVVRATWVSSDKQFAVTAGVAVLPTKAAAQTAVKAGDANTYEWFRGMIGRVAKRVDQAGGYAASTVRGRYIIYSYTTYLNGRPAANDRLLASVGKQFVAYAVRPIERRAR